MSRRLATVLATLSSVALLVTPSVAGAHGGGSAESEAMAMQPARTLAQQALAELRVRNDVKEAAERLDAALESKDKSRIDVAVLRDAMETVDKGDPKGAIPLFDRALSLPLGASSGKALHEAGREFQPATGAQEIVAIAAGAGLLILGALLLWRSRRRPGVVGPPPPHQG
jgi:LPXTG-motif cell wall-anchored protein